MEEIKALLAISPIDGRFCERTEKFRNYFSEYAYFKYRLLVEIKYLLFLASMAKIFTLSNAKMRSILKLINDFSPKEAEKIKEYESKTGHDVKALEYYLKDKTGGLLKDKIEFIHFGLTSDDVNNIALSLSLKDAMEQEIFPEIQELLLKLKKMSISWRRIVIVGRTHGQPAVPTTLGKEIAVFAYRINQEYQNLKRLKISGKLNGAVGNFNAHHFAFSKINWIKFSSDFLKSLGLEPVVITTQIEGYDHLIAIFDSLRRINYILVGMCQDIWYYISINYFLQTIEKERVGSSTMPQKVNPIDFEQAEGNLTLANSFFEFFARKLPISRLQRDLSDSSIRRNIGVAITLCYLGYESIIKGLSKILPNLTAIKRDLSKNWGIVSEGIQTFLRVKGYPKPYEKLQSLTRGRRLTKKKFEKCINNLNIDKKTKLQLKKITPFNYIGLAVRLTSLATRDI